MMEYYHSRRPFIDFHKPQEVLNFNSYSYVRVASYLT